MKKTAHDLGWEVVNYILDVSVDKVPPFKKELNKIKKQREHIQEQIFIIDKIIRNNKINHEKKIIKTYKN